jgi:uncharacterized protein with FMN-binding domain
MDTALKRRFRGRVGAAAAAAVLLSGVTGLSTPIAEAVIGANSSSCVSVPGGSAGDVAVINITNIGALGGGGWGALRPSDDSPVYARAAVDQYASVNFAAGTPPNPNLALSEIGSDGRVCYDGAVTSHHVILDLMAIIPGSGITAITPVRIKDTRVTDDSVSTSTSSCVSVPGGSAGDVAVINITNIGALGGGGWGALRSSDDSPVYARAAVDQYASVNFAAGTPPNPNLALSEIGSDGRVCYDGAVTSHHVILDLMAIIPGSGITAITPVRIKDTRVPAAERVYEPTCELDFVELVSSYGRPYFAMKLVADDFGIDPGAQPSSWWGTVDLSFSYSIASTGRVEGETTYEWESGPTDDSFDRGDALFGKGLVLDLPHDLPTPDGEVRAYLATVKFDSISPLAVPSYSCRAEGTLTVGSS